MRRLLHIVGATLVGGLLFLVPIVVLTFVIEKAIELARHIIGPMREKLFPEHIMGFSTEVLLAVTLIVVFCMLVGLFARTLIARKLLTHLESGVLSNVPGYTFYKSVGKSLLGSEEEDKWQVVIVRQPEAVRIGFLVEKLEDQKLAIFVPGAPDVHNGELLFLPPEIVEPVDIKQSSVLKCLKRMGVGSAELFRNLKSSGQIVPQAQAKETS